MPEDKGFQKIEYFIKQPAHGIHSEKHALAKEISEYCGEPKKFAMYLGVIKHIGLGRAYKIFADLKQSKKVTNRAGLFMYLASAKAAEIKAGVKPKPKPKKKKKSRIKNGNNKRTE